MAIQKLLLDTNIIIDLLHRRGPDFDKTRLLMLGGRVGEFSVWISSSQVTDLIYILTDGGKRSRTAEVLERLRTLRLFINICSVADTDVDKMLATAWSDPEDALLVDLALRMHADAIITRDADLTAAASDMIRVHDCAGFFDWLKAERGIVYDEIPF